LSPKEDAIPHTKKIMNGIPGEDMPTVLNIGKRRRTFLKITYPRLEKGNKLGKKVCLKIRI
jgi:hypothetical protein